MRTKLLISVAALALVAAPLAAQARLYPRKRSFGSAKQMSAMGQKRT